MENYKTIKQLAAILILVSLLCALLLQGSLAAGESLTAEEQQALADAAFAQEKDGIQAAEDAYLGAIQGLKNLYRDTVLALTKELADADEAQLQAALDQLYAETLADYQQVQQTFDDAVAAARRAFEESVGTAEISEDLYDQYLAWHTSKELNASDTFTDFVESFTYIGSSNSNSIGSENQIANASQSMEQEQNKDQNETQNQNKETNQNRDQVQTASQSTSTQQDNGQKQSGSAGQSQSSAKGNGKN